MKRDSVIVNASMCRAAIAGRYGGPWHVYPPKLARRRAKCVKEEGDVMRKSLLAAAIFAGALGLSTAQADTVGAVAGAGTGLLVAGPPGAVVGGVVGAVWGKPFWGPSISKGHCWTDNSFHRHCNRHW
jgi:hypothetical protein